MNVQNLNKTFIEQYGNSSSNIRVFNAPGRVNLIGEHIDYNGGYVLPAALEFGTTLLIRERNDNEIHFFSTNLPYTASMNVSDIGASKTGEWIDYPIGVMAVSYTHLTLPTKNSPCRSRWSPYH